MYQLIYASLSHAHYWYEMGMLKLPANVRVQSEKKKHRLCTILVLIVYTGTAVHYSLVLALNITFLVPGIKYHTNLVLNSTLI